MAEINELERRIAGRHVGRGRKGATAGSHAAHARTGRRIQRRKTYLDTVVSLPWQRICTEDNLDVDHAHGAQRGPLRPMEEIRDRILEFLAVRKLRAERKEEGEEEDLRDKIGANGKAWCSASWGRPAWARPVWASASRGP
ncbi:MAG: hypothetical protein R3A10_14175 [Caldilineaceae bacterium]